MDIDTDYEESSATISRGILCMRARETLHRKRRQAHEDKLENDRRLCQIQKDAELLRQHQQQEADRQAELLRKQQEVNHQAELRRQHLLHQQQEANRQAELLAKQQEAAHQAELLRQRQQQEADHQAELLRQQQEADREAELLRQRQQQEADRNAELLRQKKQQEADRKADLLRQQQQQAADHEAELMRQQLVTANTAAAFISAWYRSKKQASASKSKAKSKIKALQSKNIQDRIEQLVDQRRLSGQANRVARQRKASKVKRASKLKQRRMVMTRSRSSRPADESDEIEAAPAVPSGATEVDNTLGAVADTIDDLEKEMVGDLAIGAELMGEISKSADTL